jgi:hypothetical protein
MTTYLSAIILSWSGRWLAACLSGTCLLASCAHPRQHPPGGYPYPEFIRDADTDNYFLPIRKLVPRKDSLMYVNANYQYRMFHEPNLSIRYRGQDEYRLTYEAALFYPTMIILTPGKIVVKHETKGVPFYPENENLLDSLERFHFQLLQYRYPLDEYPGGMKRKRYYDSLIKVYPQLRSPAYYQYLLKKAIDPHAETFAYYERVYPITDSQYRYLVNLIDSSGYWKLPYTLGCKPENIGFDGDGFTLEANTRDGYNVVSRSGCAADSGLALAKACQQLVKSAHKDDSIHLFYDHRSLAADSTRTIVVQDVPLEEVREHPRRKHSRPHQQ